MKKRKWLIRGLWVIVLIVLIAAAWFLKENAVSIGHEHSLSELSEDEAVMVLRRDYSGEIIVVNKQGKWKTINKYDWEGAECDIGWDAILQDDKVPWQESKLPFHWYFLKRAINVKPFRLKLPKMGYSTVAPLSTVSYGVICFDGDKRVGQIIGVAGQNGLGDRTQWDLRLLGMRAALDQLDKEREKMEE